MQMSVEQTTSSSVSEVKSSENSQNLEPVVAAPQQPANTIPKFASAYSEEVLATASAVYDEKQTKEQNESGEYALDAGVAGSETTQDTPIHVFDLTPELALGPNILNDKQSAAARQFILEKMKDETEKSTEPNTENKTPKTKLTHMMFIRPIAKTRYNRQAVGLEVRYDQESSSTPKSVLFDGAPFRVRIVLYGMEEFELAVFGDVGFALGMVTAKVLVKSVGAIAANLAVAEMHAEKAREESAKKAEEEKKKEADAEKLNIQSNRNTRKRKNKAQRKRQLQEQEKAREESVKKVEEENKEAEAEKLNTSSNRNARKRKNKAQRKRQLQEPEKLVDVKPKGRSIPITSFGCLLSRNTSKADRYIFGSEIPYTMLPSTVTKRIFVVGAFSECIPLYTIFDVLKAVQCKEAITHWPTVDVTSTESNSDCSTKDASTVVVPSDADENSHGRHRPKKEIEKSTFIGGCESTKDKSPEAENKEERFSVQGKGGNLNTDPTATSGVIAFGAEDVEYNTIHIDETQTVCVYNTGYPIFASELVLLIDSLKNDFTIPMPNCEVGIDTVY